MLMLRTLMLVFTASSICDCDVVCCLLQHDCVPIPTPHRIGEGVEGSHLSGGRLASTTDGREAAQAHQALLSDDTASSAMALAPRAEADADGALRAAPQYPANDTQPGIRSEVIVRPPASQTFAAAAAYNASGRRQDMAGGGGGGGGSLVEVVPPGRHCCRRVGNTILLCGRHPGTGVFPFKCLVGPDWPCLICTYLLILVPNIMAFVFVYGRGRAPPWGAAAFGC